MLKIIAIILMTILNILAADVVIASASETRYRILFKNQCMGISLNLFIYMLYT